VGLKLTKVKAIKPLNHKGRKVQVNEEIELDEITAKKLIEVKAVKELKQNVTSSEFIKLMGENK
jgi:hypothetical protein